MVGRSVSFWSHCSNSTKCLIGSENWLFASLPASNRFQQEKCVAYPILLRIHNHSQRHSARGCFLGGKVVARWTCQLRLFEMGIGGNTGETFACAIGETFTAKLQRWGTSLFNVVNNVSVITAVS